MARRKFSSSGPALSSYAGDFSASAAAGNTIKAAHYNETVGYISKIKAVTGLAESVTAGNLAYAINAASTRLSTDEAKGVQDNSTTCTSGCTGLCYTSCSGGCRSTCTASCADDCSGGCKGGCSTGCQGGCKTGCNTTCSGGCNWGCTNGCIDHCTSPHGNCSFNWGNNATY